MKPRSVEQFSTISPPPGTLVCDNYIGLTSIGGQGVVGAPYDGPPKCISGGERASRPLLYNRRIASVAVPAARGYGVMARSRVGGPVTARPQG